jgi:carboxymethylenebutenolidase
VSVLKGEGKVPILFGSSSIAAGSVIHRGYLARPDLAGEWPTIIVLAGAWGVTSSAKDICRRLARHGFAAVAPDLYVGAAPARTTDADAAALAAMRVPARRTAAIVEDIVEFIQNPAGYWSNAEHGYGVLGIGSGARPAVAAGQGRDVLAAAFLSPQLVAPQAPDADEVPLDETPSLASVAAPILGISGGADEALPKERLETVRAVAPHAEWIVYDGLGADFADDYRDGFDQPAFADAMERLTTFFEKTLPAG